MRSHLLKRLGQAVLVLWAAYTLSFILLSALPGNAITNRIQSPDSDVSPEGAQALLTFYGLNRPLWEQYGRGLLAAVHGDLGYSLSNARPVSELIGEALPSTLRLTLLGLAFGIVLAVIVAVAINYAPWGWLRSVGSSVPALFGSVPTFVVGILVLQFFAFRFELIPSVDDGSFRALIAPAATLGIVLAATLSQVFATSIRSTRSQSFVHVQHAKGAGEGYIFRKDVLRNSSLPVLTLLGLAFGELVAGSVVTEAVFARGGIGQLVVGAVNTQDLPVVQGVVLLSAVGYVVINLLVDLAYPFIDPRILVEGKAKRGTRSRLPAAALSEPIRPARHSTALGDRGDTMTTIIEKITASTAPTEEPLEIPADTAVAPPARWRRSLRWLGNHWSLVLSIAVVAVILLWALVPGWFTSYGPLAVDPANKLRPPSGQHWFGTDQLGRDLYSRVVHGARSSLMGSAIAVSLGVVLGSLLGAIAGWFGGFVDNSIGRAIDVLLSIPGFLFAITIVALLGFGIVQAAVAVGFTLTASFARLIRSDVLKARTSNYVEAAITSGASTFDILRRHVIPNSIGPTLALITVQFGIAIIWIASLSFLGLGAQPPEPEWGRLVADGRNYIATRGWLTLWPSLTVVLVVLATNHISHHLTKKRSQS